MPHQTAEEKKFQAQMDARTLGEAEAIRFDTKRLDAAKKEAATLASEKEAEAAGMKKVTKIKPSKRSKRNDPKQ